MNIKKENNKDLEKKLNGLTKTLNLVSEEIDKMKMGYKDQRVNLSEPYRFFSEILYVLLFNSTYIEIMSEDAEMDIDYLRDKIEESKFRFSKADLKLDENRVPYWYKSFYQALSYLQEMNYISVSELKNSVSKFTIEITPSAARSLKNYNSDRRPIYFRHEKSEFAIKINSEGYIFYNHLTGEKIKTDASIEIEDFRKNLSDLFRHCSIKIPKSNKSGEQLKIQ